MFFFWNRVLRNSFGTGFPMNFGKLWRWCFLAAGKIFGVAGECFLAAGKIFGAAGRGFLAAGGISKTFEKRPARRPRGGRAAATRGFCARGCAGGPSGPNYCCLNSNPQVWTAVRA